MEDEVGAWGRAGFVSTSQRFFVGGWGKFIRMFISKGNEKNDHDDKVGWSIGV